jgi:hypothetical protein
MGSLVSYVDTQSATARLITEKGRAVTLSYPSAASYDTATGVGTVTNTTVVTTGLALPLSRGLKHMAGSDIAANDQQLLLPGSIDEPPLDTKATIGSVDYVITEVSAINPGGTPLLYDCIIRGVA